MGDKQLIKLVITEGYELILLNDRDTGKLVSLRVNRLIALTFKGQDRKNQDDVVDHDDSNRQNNHIRNLAWMTQRANVVKGIGITVVAEEHETGAKQVFQCIADCAEVYGILYPKLYRQLRKAEKVVKRSHHTFYRDPKSTHTETIKFIKISLPPLVVHLLK